MADRLSKKRVAPLVVSAAALALAAAALFRADVAAQAPPAGPPPAQQAAALDLTGTWVSVVTEDWRWRMMTPPKGDVSSIPVTQAARDAANQWDPAKDTGDAACKSYAAPAIMRVPTRLRISWQDANTLKIEADAGTQTRLVHFNNSAQAPAPGTDAGWQGFSVGTWEYAGGRNPFAGGGGRGGAGGGGGAAAAANPGGAANPAGGAAAPAAPAAAPAGGGRGAGGGAARGPVGGDLRVVTTNVRPGYLRKNGVPFGAQATVTEFFDRHVEPTGAVWLVVVTRVTDPQYLNGTFTVSSHFKLEPDASKFKPTPCSAS